MGEKNSLTFFSPLKKKVGEFYSPTFDKVVEYYSPTFFFVGYSPTFFLQCKKKNSPTFLRAVERLRVMIIPQNFPKITLKSHDFIVGRKRATDRFKKHSIENAYSPPLQTIFSKKKECYSWNFLFSYIFVKKNFPYS